MLFYVCCVVARSSRFAVRCACVLFVVCCLFVVYWFCLSLFVDVCVLIVGCWLLAAGCCYLLVVGCLLLVAVC